MKNLLLGVLLASAATSALAQSEPQPAPAQSEKTGEKPAAKPASDGKPAAKPGDKKKADQGPSQVKEVTVTARTDDFRSSIDRRSYDITKDLQATTGSVADALRNVPSVEVDVNGNVSLRGDSNVKILIDGKPSTMLSGASKGQILQQMPADSIARVEVMTNPSAEFSPDGSAGIINLVTKKTRKPGKTGGIRANVGTGDRWNMGVNGAWKTNKLTLSADANVRRDEYGAHIDGSTEGTDPGGAAFSQESRSVNNGVSNSRILHGGLDYDLTAKDRLSAEAHYGKFDNDTTSSGSFEARNGSGALTQAYSRTDNVQSGFDNSGLTGTWRRTFAGDDHNFVASLTRDHSSSRSDDLMLETFTAPAPLNLAERRLTLSDDDTTQLKADYNRPLPSGGRFKTGYDVQRIDASYDNLDSTGPSAAALTPNPAQTNQFDWSQTVQALYATWEQPIGRLTVLGGLRFEDTRVRFQDVTGHQSGARDYDRLYPTLHLGWKIDDDQSLTASYSERIQRPYGQDFNPFRIVYSPTSVRSGNPDLMPQETQSFEGIWQYRHSGMFYLATLYWRQTKNGFEDVTTDLGGGVLYTTRENVGRSRNGGLELVANGKLGSTLSYNVSTNTYWREIDASGLGLAVRSGWTTNGRGSLNWQATPKDLLQAQSYFSAGTVQAQGRQGAFGVLNLGYRHKFSDSLSFVATGRDVLHTARFDSTIDTPTLKQQEHYRPDQRAVYVGLAWTFGGRSPRDNQFDYGNGGGGGGGPGA
ncbi:MAG: TonB-dependent receptor [Proteobacteria bacterium]|nr:TonB-dependent receptor [Pseudomonadota bacterium]